jgi:hypothetical protein
VTPSLLKTRIVTCSTLEIQPYVFDETVKLSHARWRQSFQKQVVHDLPSPSCCRPRILNPDPLILLVFTNEGRVDSNSYEGKVMIIHR